MLEKIGLPPKPSVRGNTWVVDASHCQGCSSQFTFINRKHHCRRCGGIFCSSCTQQRMLLRGQGDSPVRICDPCKSLEEAARFERYGHKNRAVRGSSRLASRKEDDILNQILGNEDKVSSSQITSSASSSNNPEVVAPDGGDLAKNLSLDQPTNMLTEVESATPDELREQATLEKKKYSTLKAEGKREEALRAFKRGKELERQAAALEITLKRNRKRPLPFSNPSDVKTTAGKNILSGQKNKAKDDLSAELKELGWSDMDVHDSEKKTSSLSVEGELASLLREVAPPKAENEKKVINADKAQVIALKKRALELKRSGILNEAKEELKRAKILERKIEEDELLGVDADSDDELSALIRSMDSDEHDDFTATRSDLNFSFDHFIDNGDDLGMDGNFEVTEDDMDDPEIASALKSLGWAEDVPLSADYHEQAAPSKSERLQTEILSLKREAVSHKRAGNTAEAMTLLRKAKLLETELESFEHGSDLIDLGSAVSQTGPFPHAAEEPKPARKSKLVIQRELIALKKKALSLRREGKVDESEEELRKAKVLEQQLEETNIAPATTEPNIIKRQAVNDERDSHLAEGEDEVTDQDMHDPSYLSLLKNLGWEEEDNMKIRSSMLNEDDDNFTHTSDSSITGSASNFGAGTSRKSKSEIQRELLALKRKALALRRQGEAEEADEVLKMAKLLEAQLQEYEEPIQREVPTVNNKELETRVGDSVKEDKVRLEKPEETVQVSVKPSVSQPSTEPHIHESSSSEPSVSQTSPGSLKQEILAHKRKAISLKREGKLAEAKAELWQAKLLEKRVEAETFQTSLNSSDASTAPDVPSSVDKKETSPILDSKSLSSRDKFKIQQESLGHKRQALKLRREGKTAEADAEFELAKALESQLQESDSQDPKTIDQVEETSETSLNSSDASAASEVPSATKKDASPSSVSKPLSGRDRFKIQQKSLGHKRQALKLRREGKTAEADAEFELAKALESQLQELDSQDSKTSEQVDDVTVEDFLDPQLLSALQSIGLEDVRTKTPGTERPEPTKSVSENVDNGDTEREQLAERIKAEKVKAVNFKRSGKQAEALDALRRAKLYEKKLQSLTPPM